MTLSDFLSLWPNFSICDRYRDTVALLDRPIQWARSWLWELTDYRVCSVSKGRIWLKRRHV